MKAYSLKLACNKWKELFRPIVIWPAHHAAILYDYLRWQKSRIAAKHQLLTCRSTGPKWKAHGEIVSNIQPEYVITFIYENVSHQSIIVIILSIYVIKDTKREPCLLFLSDLQIRKIGSSSLTIFIYIHTHIASLYV